MTVEDRKIWNDGKALWHEYVNINGYSFKPTLDGVKKLSRLLDLNVSYLMNRISFYLDN
ncbi:hypothetical protein [Clostridium sp. WB02_MRS01]|uniref:hypothetical protein n=1 Tax=Clostridium sp. WB02_MRS01 TaxID=2605777 RepID=UPI0012B42C16|nr:hypothetical protein [Clostridium sp. WB02_MRS01]